MNFPILQYTPPIEPFCIWTGGFTQEECDSITQICELLEFQKGKIGTAADSTLDKEVRNSDITWVHPTNQNDWIFKRLGALMGRINYDKFQLDLDCFEPLQYSKYGPDQHYNWHTDTVNTPPNPELFRKLSFSVMLTDPKDYEGGELLLAPNGNNEKCDSLKRNRGDIVVFYSNVPHKVAPVTKGERVTLVTWAMGPKPR